MKCFGWLPNWVLSQWEPTIANILLLSSDQSILSVSTGSPPIGRRAKWLSFDRSNYSLQTTQIRPSFFLSAKSAEKGV